MFEAKGTSVRKRWKHMDTYELMQPQRDVVMVLPVVLQVQSKAVSREYYPDAGSAH